MFLPDLIGEANASIIDHHERGHFTADEAISRLTANGLSRREAMKSLGFNPDCDAALLPLDNSPVEPCIHEARHDGKHENAQGRKWSDPLDDEG